MYKAKGVIMSFKLEDNKATVKIRAEHVYKKEGTNKEYNCFFDDISDNSADGGIKAILLPIGTQFSMDYLLISFTSTLVTNHSKAIFEISETGDLKPNWKIISVEIENDAQ